MFAASIEVILINLLSHVREAQGVRAGGKVCQEGVWVAETLSGGCWFLKLPSGFAE